jgi:hypothetical protein
VPSTNIYLYNHQGEAQGAIEYFKQQGYPCPQYANPATFFMQCMNPEGLMIQQLKDKEDANIELTDELKEMFNQRVLKMVSHYKQSSHYAEMKSSYDSPVKKDSSVNTASFFTQYRFITLRGLLNELRDPMDVRMKIITALFMSVMILVVFNNVKIFF